MSTNAFKIGGKFDAMAASRRVILDKYDLIFGNGLLVVLRSQFDDIGVLDSLTDISLCINGAVELVSLGFLEELAQVFS